MAGTKCENKPKHQTFISESNFNVECKTRGHLPTSSFIIFSAFLRIYPAFIAGRCACRLRSQQLMGEAFRLRNARYTLKRHVPSLHVTPPSQNMPSAHPMDVPRDTFVWLRARRIQKSKA